MQHTTLMPSPWEQYSDEAAHYSYVRCLGLGTLYEVVRVTHDKNGQQAEFVHQTIFMAEYDEQTLVKVLKAFGYDSLDAFVCEVNHADVDPAGFVTRADGSIDREASSAWWIDYMLLASLMAEHFTGREMSSEAADALAKSIVETTCDPHSTFCIQRTFIDQPVSIPLTKAEVDMIYSLKDKQARMDFLRDEIMDLEEDDDCFAGSCRESLAGDKNFMELVFRRWYHYNGHGGDQTENLREAIKVTIHERFPAKDGNDAQQHKGGVL